jgi:hypothetical protein
MFSKKTFAAFIILSLAGLSMPLPVKAQAAFSSEKWTFEFTPNFWASGLKVDAKQGLLPEQEMDVSFSDIMEKVHLGLSGLFEVRKGRWGLLFDGMYVDLGETVETPYGDVEFGLKNSAFSLAGMYRAVEGKAALDILGGARYNNMSNELELTSGPYVGRSVSSTDDWVDGFVGARLIVWLAKAWALVGYADVGTGGTEITWQAWGWLDWRISRVFALKAGYRHSYFNREDGANFFKQTKSGFYAGLGLNF